MQNRKLEDVCGTNLNNTPVITVRDLDGKENAQPFLRNRDFFPSKGKKSRFWSKNK